ncbi:hypothetical protein GGX14DRAFT_473354 [Mycena pura]|uniref:Uncharacterized protein n=1 Tax=Mycena pura TaxID=153505 RepID=A0AAD6UYD9_9AGAR|nr:hypothetical protein GGX14DRAFT_473354 [Mycena pura]
MDDAPPQLLISALAWIGEPTTWISGELPEHIGTYRQVATARLNRLRVATELAAVEYTPATETSFQYTRHANVGTSSSTVTYEGGVFGENMPPLVRICLPSQHPWPERFKRSEYYNDDDIERPRAGPPFHFYNIDWNGGTGIDPDSFSGLTFSPDLPGQLATDTEPDGDEGHEQDSTVGLGWHGPWATALLERQDRGQPLGEKTEIVWNFGNNATWGVQVRLRESRGIASYTIRATILRVFVRSQWFVQEDESDKTDGDGDESEEDGDEEME